MAGMQERAALAAYGRIEQHWPDAFDECQSQDTDCCQGEDCAEDITDAVLAVVADVDGIAGVLAGHMFGLRPDFSTFWLPTCSCGWVASTLLAVDRARHQAEAVAAYILDRQP